MGVKDVLKDQGRGRRSSRRDEVRAERDRQRSIRAAVDIQSIDPTLLLTVVEAAVAIDGAIRIGASRDGGAFAIGIYGDGDPHTEYVGGDEDINEYLTALREYLIAIRP